MGRHTHGDEPRERRRPPPDRRRGPTRRLSDRAARFASRAAATDRRERFRQRRHEVDEGRRTRHRRELLTVVLTGASTLVALVVVGALVAGPTGAAVGLGTAALLALGVSATRWMAARRGATAWDWQLQRHRLIANPSEHVRDLDEPGDERSGHGRFWEV